MQPIILRRRPPLVLLPEPLVPVVEGTAEKKQKKSGPKRCGQKGRRGRRHTHTQRAGWQVAADTLELMLPVACRKSITTRGTKNGSKCRERRRGGRGQEQGKMRQSRRCEQHVASEMHTQRGRERGRGASAHFLLVVFLWAEEY